MKIRLLPTLLVLFLLVFSSQVSSNSAEKLLPVASSAQADESIDALTKAAKSGNAKAQFDLGMRYESGQGVKPDEEKSLEWLNKAANQGSLEAQLHLGSLYSKGEKLVKDEQKASSWFEKAAAQGDADAQYWIALRYFEGQGVLKDPKKGLPWLQKAADAGNAPAQANLASLYEAGGIVPKDMDKAVSWYQKAADKNYKEAQTKLATMYYLGTSIKKDSGKAFSWSTKAAENGDPLAQYLLGTLYAQGAGTEKNETLAIKWLEKAAKQKQVFAQRDLARLYLSSNEFNDYKKAVYWYQKAVKQGDASAKSELSKLADAMAQAYISQIKTVSTPESVAGMIKGIPDAPSVAQPIIVAWIQSNAATVLSPYLALLAEKKLDSTPQAAIEWYTISKLRIDKDIARCSGAKTLANKGWTQALKPETIAPKANQYFIDHPNEAATAGKKALEWNTAHPPANSPDWLCNPTPNPGASQESLLPSA
jgi:TPR repeat protein